jgi:hypothetical protein
MVLCPGPTIIDSIKNNAERQRKSSKIAMKLACGMRNVNYLSN